MRRSIAILNILLALFSSISFSATNECINFYLPEKTFAISQNLNVNYADSFLFSELEKNYSVKWVTNLGPILNQKNWGFCHLYGFFGEITREYKQRTNGQDPNISIHYMAFHHWLGRAIELALKPSLDASLKPKEGGGYVYDIELFKQIGSMKLDEYLRLGGKTDVEGSLNKFLEDSILTETISRMHDQQNLVNEIFKSEFSDKELATLSEGLPASASQETRVIRARVKHLQNLFDGQEYRRIDEFKTLVAEKEKAFTMKSTVLTKEQLQSLKDLSNGRIRIAQMSNNQIKQIKDSLQKDVKQEIIKLFSIFFFNKEQPPKEVMDLKKNVKLAEELFSEIAQYTVSINVDENALRYGKQFILDKKPDFVNKHIYLKASLPALYNVIARNVELNNNGVWIGYDHNDPFVDESVGLMSLKAFTWSPRSPYKSRYTRFQRKNIINGGHAVQIVGTIREKISPELEQAGNQGELKAFIIQNSWGTEAGQGGFYIMDKSYADAFLFNITFRDETGSYAQQLQDQSTNDRLETGFKNYIKREKAISKK